MFEQLSPFELSLGSITISSQQQIKQLGKSREEASTPVNFVN
jgi:hypothetical protein